MVKDTERPPAERPVDVTTTTSTTTSFSKKKKSDGFCLEFEFGYFGYFGQIPKNPDVFCTKLYFW